jgi:hypothetical protein
MDAS